MNKRQTTMLAYLTPRRVAELLPGYTVRSFYKSRTPSIPQPMPGNSQYVLEDGDLVYVYHVPDSIRAQKVKTALEFVFNRKVGGKGRLYSVRPISLRA